MSAVITYRLQLDQPVLAGTTGGDPSSASTFRYLPGGLMRGALIGAHLRRHGEPLPRYFLDGSVRFLHAYPEGRNRDRALPTPRSWFVQKNDPDWNGDEREPRRAYALTGSPAPGGQLETPDEPFFTARGARERELLDPSFALAIHTRRDREYGRARAGSGDVFRYEALAPGQIFAAAIVCDADDVAASIQALLAGQDTWYLGGSRSAEYGGVSVLEQRAVPSDEWMEGGLRPEGESFLLTLLSDTIVRDANGCIMPDEPTLTAALGRRLGFRPEAEKVFIAQREVAGFNRTWGLPLPQERALAMGSVVRYRLPAGAGSDALYAAGNRLAWEGLGERRAEGFGQIAIGPLGVDEFTVRRGEVAQAAQAAVEMDEESRLLAEVMVQRMLTSRAEAALTAWPNTQRITSPARNSQLSRLRALIREVMPLTAEEAGQRLDAFLRDIDSRDAARRQFMEARVGPPGALGTPLLTWIRQLRDNPTRVRTQELQMRTRNLPALGGIRPQQDRAEGGAGGRAELSDFRLTLRLIDAVLARAMKEDVAHGD